MARRKRYYVKRGRRLVLPEISLTPLIDMALSLLVIFIITTPMMHNGIQVNLPHGKSKEVAAEREVVVTMSADDTIYVNGKLIERDSLVESVRLNLEKLDKKPVFINADEAISYGKVYELIDELKQAGVKYIAMSSRSAA